MMGSTKYNNTCSKLKNVEDYTITEECSLLVIYKLVEKIRTVQLVTFIRRPQDLRNTNTYRQ
jgi:hypothetical protein